MRTRYLNRLLIVATLLVSTAPLYAQRQRLNVTKLKEEAQKVITSISSDTAQMRAYCEATDLGEQIAEAAREQDEKKVDTFRTFCRCSPCSTRPVRRISSGYDQGNDMGA